MDHDLGGLGIGFGDRALRRSAVTHHGRAPRGQCGQSIGTALTFRPWIIPAHCCRQLVKPAIQRSGIGRTNDTPELRQSIPGWTDLDVAIRISGSRDSFGSRIMLANKPINNLGDLAPRRCIPARGCRRQPSVDRGEDVRIGDQTGAEHHHRDDPEFDLATAEGHAQFRQPLNQFESVVHLRGRPCPADPQLSTDLRRDRLPVVDAPLHPVGGIDIGHPELTQPPRREQPASHGDPFITLGSGHLR